MPIPDYGPERNALEATWREFWLAYIALTSARLNMELGGTAESSEFDKAEQRFANAVLELQELCDDVQFLRNMLHHDFAFRAARQELAEVLGLKT
ncbi:MAG TPA: hypothetical protein VLA77_00570 [Candidatus Saccharimonadales bacterium]|nr:hypothetical protein [Candidatus Saccharimonadales bacterium]